MIGEPAHFAAELDALQEINRRVPKTPQAIEEYAAIHRIDLKKVSRAIGTLSDPLPEDFLISCTPNAKEILKYYASRCPIALVTGGHPPFQLEKLKKAGIEPSIFSKIAIPEDSIKQPYYREFAKEFLATPEEVWVCGDRIPMDLKPAHELGFNTVHMRWGRGLQMKTEPWVKYSIADLSELRKWIK